MRNLGQTMERHGYQATFIKMDCYGKFAMLYAIMDARHIKICDHVWVRVGPWCEQLEPGSVITFTAVPIKYVNYPPPKGGELLVLPSTPSLA